MTPFVPDSGSPLAAPSSAAVSRPRQSKITGNHSAMWSIVVSALLILALLLTFHQVVEGAVKQGVERNAAAALLVTANRECKAGPAPATAERCAQKLVASRSGPVIQTAFSDDF